MKKFYIVYTVCLIFTYNGFSQTQNNEVDISSFLSLFSAHAVSGNKVRINWSLDSLSPAIVDFRLYRGFDDLGNFAVLDEIPVNTQIGSLDYSYSDTSVRSGVTYYYKLATVRQSNESVFPVVISATPELVSEKVYGSELAPAAILSDRALSLYVRQGGRVKLEIVSPKTKVLVNDILKAGIYEFDLPSDLAQSDLVIELHHENGFEHEYHWPIKQ